MKKTLALTAALLSAGILTVNISAADHHNAAQHAQSWASIKEAVATLKPTEGNKTEGTIRFTQDGDKVKVVAHVTGLTPGQKHAFHIHEFGDASSKDGSSAGGHYNPEGHQHGLPDASQKHAGDLGNLQANDQGVAHYEITVQNISIAGVKNPIIGRGVIVHAKHDDGGQPVGNAGGRIAMGVIGIAGAPKK
ncbi:MAG TPA: superoxide dismutase family protein [Methylomirabilota bacterium]|nr:superoxide dismutase family protein [Methylomirabilota bacterium]